jgi:hypothetical protein
MLSRCANPQCKAEFMDVQEGELFVFELPNHVPQYHWLCPPCAARLRVVHEPNGGARVVARPQPLPIPPWGLIQSTECA